MKVARKRWIIGLRSTGYCIRLVKGHMQ